MYDSFTKYFHAYIAILAISILPNLLLFLIPLHLLTDNKKENSLNYQSMILHFASAGLIGDVFIHTLPHLLTNNHHQHNKLDNHHNNHDYPSDLIKEHHETKQHHIEETTYQFNHNTSISVTLIFGFLVFMIVEKLSLQYHHNHEHNNNNNNNNNNNISDNNNNKNNNISDINIIIGNNSSNRIIISDDLNNILNISKHPYQTRRKTNKTSPSNYNNHIETQQYITTDLMTKRKLNKTIHVDNMNTNKSTSTTNTMKPMNPSLSSSSMKESKDILAQLNISTSLFYELKNNLHITGWLNLIADSLHNFTDGIAIGASFAAITTTIATTSAVTNINNKRGTGLAYATFLSVIMHEIPHELGDFTILIQSGLTKSQAIQAQFLTAFAAILGTTVGLLSSHYFEEMEDYMLAFTAGGFLYLATMTMLVPKTYSIQDPNNKSNSSLLQIILEVICFLLGIIMMLIVAILE